MARRNPHLVRNLHRAFGPLLLAGTALTALPAAAQDGTWTGPTTSWNTPTNWTPVGVPSNRATFGPNGPTTPGVVAPEIINQILFAADAQEYLITITDTSALAINGIGAQGITNQSAFVQTFNNQGSMFFNNDATVIGGVGVVIDNENPTGSGTSAILTFDDASGIDADTILNNSGGDVTGTGMTVTGGGASTQFNDNASADGATINNRGGRGSGAGSGGTAGSGTGGNVSLEFNDSSHSDGADIANIGGFGDAVAGDGDASGEGGSAGVTFADASHADAATITNFDGGANAAGSSDGSNGNASGGTGSFSFIDSSHADGATFTNRLLGAGASGGSGSDSLGAIAGTAGGTGTALGGLALAAFSGTAHADDATIGNVGDLVVAFGGAGGAGDAAAGGAGGEGNAAGGTATIAFLDSTHADRSTIANTATSTRATGGDGGMGGGNLLGVGGVGGAAETSGGSVNLVFSDTARADGATTISNRGGDSEATGGTGGAGGGAAVGGNGGEATSSAAIARLTFSDTTSAGTAGITNRGGDSEATGGDGGNAGAFGDGGDGDSGGSSGGDAELSFEDDSSAGGATIANTAGNANATGGDGGDGPFVGTSEGGAGGGAAASGGNATTAFNDTASAGSATIVNSSGTATSAPGAPGASMGAGAGGAGGPAFAFEGFALVVFNDSATAGTATITNSGGEVNFHDISTGGGARITNNDGQIGFADSAVFGTAAGASIINQSAGTVLFVDSSSAGTGTITNSGQVFFIQDTDAVDGRIVNNAGGTFHIEGTNNGLRLGSLSGAGSVTLGNQRLDVGFLGLNDSFGGVISGTGALFKQGAGTLILSGASTYSGPTVIVAGTLQIDGTTTSATTVQPAGTLRGTGTIDSGVINDGTFAAGNAANPVGTFTVTGPFANSATGIFVPTVNGPASSLLVAGSLNLNGGTARPQAVAGSFFPMQSDYRIATGTGGRTGTFTTLDESQLPAFLDATLSYTPTDVNLRLRRNATDFAAAADLTPNQNAAATALDSAVTDGNPLVFTTYIGLYDALLLSADVPAALDNVSGDALTAFPIEAQDSAIRFGDRLAAHSWSDSSNLWGLASYADQDTDSDGNGPGFDANGVEFQIGFNTSLGPDTRLGLSLGMANGDVDVDSRLATGEVDTLSAGMHLRHDFGTVYLAGQFTYNWHEIDSARTLLLGGTASAEYDARTWTALGEVGARFAAGRLSIEPHITFRHASTDQDAFSETGPVGTLDVAETQYETTRIGIGLRLANRDPASAIRPWALVSYERELGDQQAVLDNALPGLPTFRVVGTELGEDIFTARLGVEAQLGSGLSVFVGGGGRWRSNQGSLHADAGVRIRF